VTGAIISMHLAINERKDHQPFSRGKKAAGLARGRTAYTDRTPKGVGVQ
jgi:hypothetical protein